MSFTSRRSMRYRRTFIGSFRSFKPAFAELKKNDPLKMAGATAFFTTFALPPILFILIQLFGLFMGERKAGRQLMIAIKDTVGESGAMQVRQVLRSIRSFNDNWYLIVGGFIFLLFVATTLFSVIKNSFNQIWQIGIKDRPGFLFAVSLRLRSLGVIVMTGILFIADLLIEGLEAIAGKYFDSLWKGGGYYFQSTLDEIAGVVIVSLWFITLFRYLGDARPTWKATIIGGVVTGILFSGGKLLLHFLLVNSNLSTLYGASGSIVLILLFVFYSSFILYYGASFIYVLSTKLKLAIKPVDNAFSYTINEVEKEKQKE